MAKPVLVIKHHIMDWDLIEQITKSQITKDYYVITVVCESYEPRSVEILNEQKKETVLSRLKKQFLNILNGKRKP